MPTDPYTDDEYDSTYEDVHGDEPARDQHANDETTDDGFFPSGVGGASSGLGLWPSSSSADPDYDGTVDRRTGSGPEASSTGPEESGEGTGVDGRLVGAAVAVGVVLFLIPEPTTSALGIALVAMGVVAWIADWGAS